MFEKYRRTNIAEIRPYVEGEVLPESVSISPADRANGSPKLGDMIARNPESHEDQWLIAADYFAANFEPYDGVDAQAEIERLKQEVEAAKWVVQQYFEIAEEAVGEEVIRAKIREREAALAATNRETKG